MMQSRNDDDVSYFDPWDLSNYTLTDENGKKYRQVGNTREYAPERLLSSLSPAVKSPVIVVDDVLQKKKNTTRYCPIRQNNPNLLACDMCVMCKDGDCVLKPREQREDATDGLKCPYRSMMQCVKENCAAYNGVCGMAQRYI